MNYELIFSGNVTVEELQTLNGLGYEFVAEDGKITQILFKGKLLCSKGFVR